MSCSGRSVEEASLCLGDSMERDVDQENRVGNLCIVLHLILLGSLFKGHIQGYHLQVLPSSTSHTSCET